MADTTERRAVNYFLAPRSSEKSYENFLSTIKHGVPFSRIEEFLSNDGKRILQEQEVIYSWGNRAGKKYEWEKMQTGDIVIFYARGNLVMAGEVIYKQFSSELAKAMWPLDEKGQAWAYTFFLNKLRDFRIPLSHFNNVSGYGFKAIMGFQEIAEANKNKILTHYKDFDAFFTAFADSEFGVASRLNERVYINISSEISAELSNKKIIAYKSLTQVPTKKKRNGYVDFDEVNKHRARIGSIGEQVVLRHEKAALLARGRTDLAVKVHQLSLEDTYAGYDIVSYDEYGNEKKIEVKATFQKQGNNFSFNISKNEKAVAESVEDYYIYLVFAVDTKAPKIHIIKNPFKNNDPVSVEPSGYTVRGTFATI